MPYPPKMPVINRLKLVDSTQPKYCIYQSTNITVQHKTLNQSFMYNIHEKNANTYPTSTPVHRAHTGNWYFLKKKLLSGIWWQPVHLPAFIAASHILIAFFITLQIYVRNPYTQKMFLLSFLLCCRKLRTKDQAVRAIYIRSILFLLHTRLRLYYSRLRLVNFYLRISGNTHRDCR